LQTYYDILGVPENATDAEIEAAFKSKGREVHPDKVPPGNPYLRKVAAEAFKDLSEAKSILLDHAERQKYDAGLAYMRGSTASSANPAPAPQPQPAQKFSFWKPINTKFGITVLATGAFGCILFLVGIIADARYVLPGLTFVFLALALLSWRHGMRPGTDPKILGASLFLFIFAATCFSGWIQSSPPSSKQVTPNPSQPGTAE